MEELTKELIEVLRDILHELKYLNEHVDNLEDIGDYDG